jgi:hypothetical protein
VPETKTTTKSKEKTEVGPSKKISILDSNTRKVAEHAQALGSSATMKNTRRK